MVMYEHVNSSIHFFNLEKQKVKEPDVCLKYILCILALNQKKKLQDLNIYFRNQRKRYESYSNDPEKINKILYMLQYCQDSMDQSSKEILEHKVNKLQSLSSQAIFDQILGLKYNHFKTQLIYIVDCIQLLYQIFNQPAQGDQRLWIDDLDLRYDQMHYLKQILFNDESCPSKSIHGHSIKKNMGNQKHLNQQSEEKQIPQLNESKDLNSKLEQLLYKYNQLNDEKQKLQKEIEDLQVEQLKWSEGILGQQRKLMQKNEMISFLIEQRDLEMENELLDIKIQMNQFEWKVSQKQKIFRSFTDYVQIQYERFRPQSREQILDLWRQDMEVTDFRRILFHMYYDFIESIKDQLQDDDYVNDEQQDDEQIVEADKQ